VARPPAVMGHARPIRYDPGMSSEDERRDDRVRPDPLAGSAWSNPATVAGFTQSAPNAVLMRFAESEHDRMERERRGGRCALDLGCGAGRNTIPLARLGWSVLGLDLSWPMLNAAASRVRADGLSDRVRLGLAPMDALPVRTASVDLLIAHGIWNLARSAAEFRRAVREAARVCRPDAGVFVFTFSRNTLPGETPPVAGEPFVFTEFSGAPQCFLTDAQLVAELADAGFTRDPSVPLTEYNRPRPGALRTRSAPAIYEAAFRRAR
jgi:SAM-dependent methyltransferase